MGSRRVTRDEVLASERLGEHLASRGLRVISGGAPGTDQAIARGVNRVDPNLLTVCQPWPGFESHALAPGNVVWTLTRLSSSAVQHYLELTARVHPAWSRLGGWAHLLHGRNAMIVQPPTPDGSPGDPVEAVIARPGLDRIGGTGQAMRLAGHLGVRLLNLRRPGDGDRQWFDQL